MLSCREVRGNSELWCWFESLYLFSPSIILKFVAETGRCSPSLTLTVRLPTPSDTKQPGRCGSHLTPPDRTPLFRIRTASLFAPMSASLQVIVKLTRATLALDKNLRCEAEDWHVDGMLNEHLVAGAVLVCHSENVTTPALNFCVEADLDPFECGHLDPTE